MIRGMKPEKKRELMEKMIPRMIEGVKTEDMMGMLCQAMPKMMKAMDGGDPEKRKQMMSQMIKAWRGSNGSGDMAETMRLIMPEIMEGCLSSMTQEEGKKMLSFCHTMLREMEEKFVSKPE